MHPSKAARRPLRTRFHSKHNQSIVPEHLEPRQLLSSSLVGAGQQIASVPSGQTPASAPIFADFTGDGVKDMVYAAGKNVFLARGISNGGFGLAKLAGSANAPIGFLASGDFNNDGRLDLASAGALDDFNFVLRTFFNNGDSSFRRERARKFSGAVESLVVGNVEGSATPEILTTSFDTRIYLMDANGVVRPRLDADAQPDVQQRDIIPNFPFRRLLISAVGPGFIGGDRLVFSSNDLTAPVIADMDGFGPNEIVIGSRSNLLIFVPLDGDFVPAAPKVSVLRTDGSGGFVEIASQQVTGTPQSVAVGELNGDNFPDIAYSSVTSGTGDIRGTFAGNVRVVLQQPNRAVAGTVILSDPVNVYSREFAALVGTRPQRWLEPSLKIVSVGDLNTDGKPDITVASTDDVNYPRSRSERVSELTLIPDLPLTPGPLSAASIVPFFAPISLQRVVTTGAPTTTFPLPARGEVFTIASTSSSDRPDVLVWNRTSFTGQSDLLLFRNTTDGKPPIITSAKGGINLATSSNLSDSIGVPQPRFFGEVRITNPEVMRGVGIQRVTVYYDSNNNRVLDDADEVAGQGVNVPDSKLISTQSRWSFGVIAPNNAVFNRVFIQAIGIDGLPSVPFTLKTNPLVIEPPAIDDLA